AEPLAPRVVGQHVARALAGVIGRAQDHRDSSSSSRASVRRATASSAGTCSRYSPSTRAFESAARTRKLVASSRGIRRAPGAYTTSVGPPPSVETLTAVTYFCRDSSAETVLNAR